MRNDRKGWSILNLNSELEQAIQLIDSGNHEAGLIKLDELSKKDDDEQKRTIAEIYYELGLVDRALQLAEDLLFRYPDVGELFVFAADCYIELGEEDEALDMLLEIRESDSAYVQAQLLLADLYQGQGLDEVAEQKLLQAEKKTKDEPIILFGLGEFYLSRGDYLQSIPYFKKVLNDKQFLEDYESLQPYLRIAEAYSASGQFEEALIYYEKGTQKKADINGLFGYGFTALQLEDYETTIEQLKRLLELDPDYTSAYPFLAEALRSTKRVGEAIEVLEQGIKKDEFNEELYLEMALAQFQADNMQAGREYLEKAVAINPANITAIKELLLLFLQNEDYEEILELLSFLDDYSEYDPLFERFKAKALYESDDIEGAIKAYNLALAEYDKDEDLLEEAAFAFLELGDRSRGIQLFKQLLILAPEREDIRERLFELEEELY